MGVDVFTREVEDGWAETVADAREVLDPVRQAWRDEDRPVGWDDDDRDREVA